MTARIAIWSGPRNISTAMMRSFENRPDTSVWDEPFYAHYLKATNLDHPGRDHVLANHEAEPDKVIAAMLGPVPGGAKYFVFKLMAQHMLPSVPHDWFGQARHVFLIRNPEAMVRSYAATRPDFRAEDLGYAQLRALFEEVSALTGAAPPVIAAEDVLTAPEPMLQALCQALNIPFTEKMLSWPAGPRDSDGVWAPHWYKSVTASTGFTAPRPSPHPLPEAALPLIEILRPDYEALAAHVLRPVEV